MKTIRGLENHKLLYDCMTDLADKLEKNDSFTELELRDLGMRLRYGVEYITQQFARVHELVWTTPFEIINTLLERDLIGDSDASALHRVRQIANKMAHIDEKMGPLELVESAYNTMADYVPHFLEEIPMPSEAPLLSEADVVSAEPVEESKEFPLLKIKCSSIPLLKVDSAHLDYGALLGVDRFLKYRKSAAGQALVKDAPHNGNLLEWLYHDEKKENYAVFTNEHGTFVSRSYVADQYLGRVNKLIHTYNRERVMGEPVYIPGIVQNYFGFSKVYFEGEELKYAPIEPAVILRDHALFCETVELPDCVTHVPYNDLLQQVNEFTLNSQGKAAVFSRVKHLVLPKGNWRDRMFLRCFPNLETVRIKEVGEIDPTPATGAPEVFPALTVPRDQQHRHRMYGDLKQNPKFIAFMDAVDFEQATLTVHKRGADTVTLPKWAFVGQKRFGFLAEVVYHAGCLVKGVDTKYVRVGPASSLGGFRYCNNPEQKQELIEALVVDPDFIDFVQTEADYKNVNQIRDGHRFFIYADWVLRGASYMNADRDAVYEAGCRIKGWDPTPDEIVIERRVKTKPTGKTAMQTPAGQRIPKAPAKPRKSFITRDDGFRTFDCPEGKEALVQALMADPEFVAFVKVNRARPKRKLFESPYPWYQEGSQKFRAHMDAVYEAGLRIRGFSKGPQQAAPQAPPKPVKKAAPATPKPAQPTRSSAVKAAAKPDNERVQIGGGYSISQEELQKLFDFDAWN